MFKPKILLFAKNLQEHLTIVDSIDYNNYELDLLIYDSLDELPYVFERTLYNGFLILPKDISGQLIKYLQKLRKNNDQICFVLGAIPDEQYYSEAEQISRCLLIDMSRHYDRQVRYVLESLVDQIGVELQNARPAIGNPQKQSDKISAQKGNYTDPALSQTSKNYEAPLGKINKISESIKPLMENENRSLYVVDPKEISMQTEKTTRKVNKILVVDDEDVIRELIFDVVTSKGYEVILASDGNEGYEQFKNHWPEISLVILDIIMPGMDGKELYEKIKDINPSMKVLITSGYSKPNVKAELIKMGVNGFLPKPFNIIELTDLLQKIIPN